MTAPSPDSRRVEALLADISARLTAVEDGLRAAQLSRSSIDDGVLEVRGADGTSLATWGVQPDGTAGTKSFNKTPPPAPPPPTVNPLIAGIEVVWEGQLLGNMPSDFRCVNVHVSPVRDFIVDASNQVCSLFEAGAFVVSGLPYVPHYVRMVAVNLAGAVSVASAQGQATPTKVVADAVLDGIVTETSLAAAAVTKAKLAAAAVTKTAIADASIGTPHLIAGAVDTTALAADSVAAGKIAADAITGREVKAKSLTGDSLAANSIDAGHVQAGAVTADKLESTLALASRLIAGDPTGTRVELSESGMLVIRNDGETTFSVDASSGDVVSMGQYYTQRFGERIAMNVAGLSEPAIRAYPRRGNRYADLRSYTRTVGGVDIANWEVRVPLQGQEAGLFDFMVYDANFAPYASSRLRYRPFFNASGVVHCGWAADGQNCAVVFYDGEVFIVNSANSARAPLRTGMIESDNTVYAKTLRTNGGNVITDFNNGSSGGAVYTKAIFAGDITYNNLYDRTPTSDPRKKQDRRKLDRSALAAIGAVSWDTWRWRPDMGRVNPDTIHRDRFGPMADELDADPLLTKIVVHDDEGYAVGYDATSLSGLQGAALAEAHAKLVEQDKELFSLRQEVEQLTSQVSSLAERLPG